MEAVLRRYRRGLFKTLAGSFIFHALLIAVALIFFNAGPRKVFFTPIMVSIVGQAGLPAGQAGQPAGPAGLPKGSGPAKTETAASMPEIKPDMKEERPQAKEETVKLEKTLKTSKKAEPKRLSPVEEALRHIAADVKEKDNGSLVGSSIERLKIKHEAEKKALSRGLEEIKKELFSKSTVSNTAKSAPPTPSGVAGGVAGGGAGGGAGGVTGGVAGGVTGGVPGGVPGGVAGGVTGGVPGGVAGGGAGGAIDVKYASYYNRISGMVQQEWAVYSDEFKNIRSETIVSIKIARSGGLMEVRVEKSSGNSKFDESLLNAIKKASPFPPLPKDFEEKYMDVSFRFCPSCEGKR